MTLNHKEQLAAILGLDPALQDALLGLARNSIRHGLAVGRLMSIALDEWPSAAQELRAAFVTLKVNGTLRGCIGTLDATEPLAGNVIKYAYSAAFRDPRFRPVSGEEVDALGIHISVLGQLEGIEFSSESDLAGQLRAGVDGLLLIDGFRRGTLLPSAWDDLTEPRNFVSNVKKKAGIDAREWPGTLQAFRYQTFEFTSP